MRLIAIIVLVLAASTARADDPWAVGVSAEAQAQANALFAEGNQLFAEKAHAPALDKYRAAVALWDHPLIRFNMAVTEVRLDRLLDAAADLDKALRFGPAPFSPDLYQQALDYQTLLRKQVGEVAASCEQSDVRILLDGKAWFACPGAQTQRVLAGEHVVVGERAGYLTQSHQLVVRGGATTTEKVALVPIKATSTFEYRYPRYLPLAVGGGGITAALGGVALWFVGRNQMDNFQADFTAACPQGCRLSDMPSLAAERDRAQLKGTIGTTMMITGGTVALGGAVLAVINSKSKHAVPAVEALPVPGGAAASFTLRF
jgi:hypothetical protein